MPVAPPKANRIELRSSQRKGILARVLRSDMDLTGSSLQRVAEARAVIHRRAPAASGGTASGARLSSIPQTGLHD